MLGLAVIVKDEYTEVIRIIKDYDAGEGVECGRRKRVGVQLELKRIATLRVNTRTGY